MTMVRARYSVSITLDRTGFYTQLLNFESDDWHVAHATNLKEENKSMEQALNSSATAKKTQ